MQNDIGKARSTPIPVSVITGFLGSGKTTLLRGLLRQPGMAGTAVIINEFGAVGLDHELVEAIDGETTLLQGGCVCCTVRDDLTLTLERLLRKHQDGTIAPLQRVVIETTGLADPGPILQLLFGSSLAQAYVLESVITTLDAVHGLAQWDRHPESVRQVVMADRIVLTKTDLAAFSAPARFAARIARLNPRATVMTAREGDIDAALLFGAGANERSGVGAVLSGLSAACVAGRCDHDDHGGDLPGESQHNAGIRSHSMVFNQPLDWAEVSDWLGGIAYFHGASLLRVKGILDIRGESAPIAVHGVHHLFHSPTALESWSGGTRESRLVFITQDLDRSALLPAFAATLA
jgi:G3E family GTPase